MGEVPTGRGPRARRRCSDRRAPPVRDDRRGDERERHGGLGRPRRTRRPPGPRTRRRAARSCTAPSGRTSGRGRTRSGEPRRRARPPRRGRRRRTGGTPTSREADAVAGGLVGAHGAGDGPGGVVPPAGVDGRRSTGFGRTLRLVYIPPIVMYPNGPACPTIGIEFSGTGMWPMLDVRAVLVHPGLAHRRVAGHDGLDLAIEAGSSPRRSCWGPRGPSGSSRGASCGSGAPSRRGRRRRTRRSAWRRRGPGPCSRATARPRGSARRRSRRSSRRGRGRGSGGGPSVRGCRSGAARLSL